MSMPRRASAASFTAFGPGKVILLGEHAVVYGEPALAGPLHRGVRAVGVPSRRCELSIPSSVTGSHRRLITSAFRRAARATGQPRVRVSLQSDLPIAMGLGSSAALSVACARVLLEASGRSSSADEVAKVALQMERVFHGTPSGVDHSTSAHARLIHFRGAVGKRAASIRSVASPRPLKLLVALVGERGPTHRLVSALRARERRWPRRYRRLFAELGRLADEGARAVATGDLETLGDLMNVNQGFLSALQLSSPPVEQMVHRLRRAGALGAKLTGAGGSGGAVIGLFLEPEPVVARLGREGIPCFGSQLAGPQAL